MSGVTELGDRSQFFHDIALAPLSATSTWGARSDGTSRQCTAHAIGSRALSIPTPSPYRARPCSPLLQWGDEETAREALRLVPTPWACVHRLIPPMPGLHLGARISGADPLCWPRPRRETAGPGGRMCPAPRHVDGPRPNARSASDDAPARPRCGGGCHCCPA
jgi:hypothetical protein